MFYEDIKGDFQKLSMLGERNDILGDFFDILLGVVVWGEADKLVERLSKIWNKLLYLHVDLIYGQIIIYKSISTIYLFITNLFIEICTLKFTLQLYTINHTKNNQLFQAYAYAVSYLLGYKKGPIYYFYMKKGIKLNRGIDIKNVLIFINHERINFILMQ